MNPTMSFNDTFTNFKDFFVKKTALSNFEAARSKNKISSYSLLRTNYPAITKVVLILH